MIEGAFTFIEKSLSAYLKDKMDFRDEKVISSNLVEQDGKIAIQEGDKVVISLVDIDQEPTLKNSNRMEMTNAGSAKTVQPPVNLNLYIMFSCFFSSDNYKKGLAYLSNVIVYFQGRPLFTRQSYPELIQYGIEKLSFEIYHPDYQARNNMWTILGVKYLPSVIYKVKLLSFSEQMVRQELPAISKLDNDSIKGE